MSTVAGQQSVPPASLFASGFARGLIRLASRLANPWLAPLASRGWLPMLGVLIHRGRKTGRTYRTPVGVGRSGAAVFIPLTFGGESRWYRNVEAASGATLLWRGRSLALRSPEVVDAAQAHGSFMGPLWFLLRVLGIERYLKLTIEGTPSTGAPSRSELD